MFRTPHAALAAVFVVPAAHAQTVGAEAGEAGTVVVTASRTGDDATVSVADRATIARRQPASLLAVLDDLPGVHAFSTGGPAGGSFLTIRGGEPNFTAVMIDGVRLNDPTNSAGGAFDFALLDPLIVDRVEVARTAVSAIHGSDALSGVVQIVTRDPSGPGARVGAQFWVDSRYGAAGSASLSGGWAGGGVSVAGGHYDSGDGDPAGTLRREQLFGKARQAIGSFRLSAIGLHARTRGTGFPEDSGGPLLAVVRARERRDGDLTLGAVSLTRDPAAALRPSLSLAWSLQHGDSDSPPIAPGMLDGVPATTAHDRFARFEGIGALAGDVGGLTLSVGGAVLREAGRSNGTLDFGFPLPVNFALTRVTHSGFAEATLRGRGGLSFNAALRYDKLVHGSGNWTGRGGVRWQVGARGPALFAHLANGYKRPSLYALGHPLIGDPTLKPETSRSIDAGVELPLPHGQLSVTVFDNRFSNLIDFDPVRFRLTNRDHVGARGVEGAMALRIGGAWSVAGALTYLSLDSATPLRGRPQWSGIVRLLWERGAWQADAALRGNNAVNDSAIPTGARVTPGHVEGDVGMRYRLRDHIALRLMLRNVGDNRSWDAVGTPSPGRSLRLSIAFD
ncbi:TonB-dependent receptor [Sphingomonas sp. AR_OL41]|uniref:TonB-dependent receptor plug domain-containing protein n=1 Tax=Sphingomonas sp. AR_OL41 TaxID=3042729 RepID=UPI0024819489|nr:TonB-dependent receptor [Sphingomonas sp. AR_OL41]MDH7974695.1 TonB-dependent receptor [Sphingomonas sp. AR_OL41]